MEATLKNYDLSKLNVVTIASHSSLQILRGAKRHGLGTVAVAKPGSGWFYRRFNFIDNVIEIDLGSMEQLAGDLVKNNAILIPHGSYVEYVGWRRALSMPIPTFGNRYIIEWEADQRKKMRLLEYAGIPIPRSFNDPTQVDRPVIVKLSGAKGGRGYFIAKDAGELAGKLSSINTDDYIIQEYVIGVPAYYHYFDSKVYDRVELFGMDLRYESNVDGRLFNLAEPTFVVTGNIPLVLRESLLPTVQKYGEDFSRAVAELVPPGMIGPYSLESIIKDDLSIVVFEFSGRIVAGTNVYMGVGSPYSVLYFNEPMDMGERIAHEIVNAVKRGKLINVLT
ncbi:formate--phosphoribosylaminoimidazolecarboxamide ligase [Caldivirga maquilingensis]|uniref:formate--phosphoribosylaminoimidazolecarboxamide ligase n=1 Tax=Caldivirga maquilingensis TaxID=76887 RepID=UPI0012E9FB2C|nr:formate--phosphoribosylaminoimidazolecarboxamide ligase [Caldivirga maquilingensis]